MSRPRWFDELPESITEAEYRNLPFVVVVLDDEYDIGEIREFHLDAAAAAYRLHAVHRSVLSLEEPVLLKMPISDLVTG